MDVFKIIKRSLIEVDATAEDVLVVVEMAADNGSSEHCRCATEHST